MDATSSQALILSSLTDLAVAVMIILTAVSVVAIGYLVYRLGFALLHALWHADGTTNWLGSHWSWYDRMTYSPWKGYNRLRSRKWNMEHM